MHTWLKRTEQLRSETVIAWRMDLRALQTIANGDGSSESEIVE